MTLPNRQAPVKHAVRTAVGGRGLGVSPVLLVLAGFIGLVMYVGPMFSPFYLHSIDVTDPRLAALPLSGMSVGALMMTGNYGRLYARLGAHKLFAMTLVLSGLGLLAAGFAPNLPVFMAAMFCVSCGIALFAPNVNSHIAATSSNPARGIGWAMSAMFAVQVAFPFIARAISQATSPAGVFISFGICALVPGIATTVFAWRRGRHHARPQGAEQA